MRVVVTLPWGERLGGAEAMLQAVLDGAQQSAVEMQLVFFQDGPWPRELREAGFTVDVIPAGRLRQPHVGVAAVARLARLLRERRPDLILNWSAKTHLYGSPAALLAGMGDRVMWWQQSIPAGDWIDRAATLAPACAIACYSEAAARAQRRVFPSRPTFVIPAGAPVPSAVTPAEVELPDGVPVVGLVGRLQPWKGQDRMLHAHAILRARGHSLHTLIVGGDSYELSPEYAASLGPLAERLGIAQEVTMTGQVPDASPYIARMDVLVNASDPEPFGIVLLEGMAQGVAVLAVNSGGPSEFIDDGVTGALAVSGEPQALADALEPLLLSPGLRAALAAAGRERFLADYTDAAMRERFFSTMEAIASSRTAGDGEGS